VTALSRPALSHRNTSTAQRRHSRSSRKAMLRTACWRCAPRSCSAGSSGVLAAVSTRTNRRFDHYGGPALLTSNACWLGEEELHRALAHLNHARDHTSTKSQGRNLVNRRRGKNCQAGSPHHELSGSFSQAQQSSRSSVASKKGACVRRPQGRERFSKDLGKLQG
jgi:hypothetical protein